MIKQEQDKKLGKRQDKKATLTLNMYLFQNHTLYVEMLYFYM